MSDWIDFGASILVALFCFVWVYLNRARFVAARRNWNFTWIALGVFWLAVAGRDLLQALQVMP